MNLFNCKRPWTSPKGSLNRKKPFLRHLAPDLEEICLTQKRCTSENALTAVWSKAGQAAKTAGVIAIIAGNPCPYDLLTFTQKALKLQARSAQPVRMLQKLALPLSGSF